MAVTVAIADDDSGMRSIMRKILEKAGGYEIVGEADSGDALIDLFEEKRPSVLVMDVEMPGKTGIECARIIQDIAPRTVMIFSTAHEKYMSDAFEVYAFDYLLKPFKAERALRTFNLVRDRLEEKQTVPVMKPRSDTKGLGRIMLRNRDGVSFVDIEKILLVQREERQTVIYTEDSRFTTGDALGEIEEKLPPELFMRTHKSYIVNISHIATITPYGRWTFIVTINGLQEDALITHDKYEELQAKFS